MNLQSEELQKIMSIEAENKKLKNLFKNCVFYISREVPIEIFGLAILSSGGVYGDESDNTPFKIVKFFKIYLKNLYYYMNFRMTRESHILS